MAKNSLDKEIKVYFCPRCESMKVKYVFEMGNIFGVIPQQRCMQCKFEMNGFPMLVTTKRKLEEDLKNKTKKKVKRKIARKKKSVKKIKKKVVGRKK